MIDSFGTLWTVVSSAIAVGGIALKNSLEMPVLDGAVSVLIGTLLAGMATLLTWKSRGLFIGEGIRLEMAQAICELALAQPGVRWVGRVLSMEGGPDDILVTVDLDFDAGTDVAKAAAAIGKGEWQVRERFTMIERLFILSGSGPTQRDGRAQMPSFRRSKQALHQGRHRRGRRLDKPWCRCNWVGQRTDGTVHGANNRVC